MRLAYLPRGLALYCCLFALRADDVQALVEKIYPKSERLKEIRMGDIVRELGVAEGSRVADVGCGSGQFSVILSHVVGPTGKVYCEDINDNQQFGLGSAKKNLKKEHVKNVELIHGAADDPKLPAGLDAVLIVNSYHEMPQYQAMLRHISESLKAGGHLVIEDNTPLRTGKRPREKQTRNHVLAADLAAGELQAAGFHIVHRDDGFIDNPDAESAHWLIAAAKE
jgi:ubiquinone/menaquinone biosynthesis C-methylase UbiE